MKSRILVLAVAAVAAATAPATVTAAPATVTVRVEGDAATLVPRTTLTTTTTPVVKDGESCSGTSAAGALQQATGGDWAGTSSQFGLSVDAIKGEAHVFNSGEFWEVFLNDVVASAGVCGLELQPGDDLLFAAVPEAGGPNPLALEGVPSTATAGCPVAVRVVRTVTTFGPAPDFLPTATREPVGGATISGSASATTGADGIAVLTFGAAGSVRATKAGEIRSASEPVAVAAGACGPVVAPTGTALPSRRDRTAPRARISGIRDGARYPHGKGPRTLAGRVGADPSGLADVRLRLKRNRGGVCAGWSAGRERFVRIARCGTHRFGRWFSVGNRARWSYLLPARLGRGRYVLDVQAVDRAGNATLIDRGRTRVIFHVR